MLRTRLTEFPFSIITEREKSENVRYAPPFHCQLLSAQSSFAGRLRALRSVDCPTWPSIEVAWSMIKQEKNSFHLSPEQLRLLDF
jgi:hypothetical protein